MKEIIKSVKDFKIIPLNFESACAFELLKVLDDSFKIKLLLNNEFDIKDYNVNDVVEVFGVNNVGLVYFETKILNKESDCITLSLVDDYSVIQRREYSRVELNNGSVEFKDLGDKFIEKIIDISAGGMKFLADTGLQLERFYDIVIHLSNNMNIECSFQPIRIDKNDNKYVISGKFLNLENVDRVVLVQYAFKIKMQQQNNEDKM